MEQIMAGHDVLAVPAGQRSVRHAEWGYGVVMSIDPDRLTVLFDDVSYETLSPPAVHEHNLLLPASREPARVLRKSPREGASVTAVAVGTPPAR